MWACGRIRTESDTNHRLLLRACLPQTVQDNERYKTMHATPPILALTMGDVNGVGPEILVKALSRPEVRTWCRPVVFGDLAAWRRAAAQVPGAPSACACTTLAEATGTGDTVPVYDAGVPAPSLCPGQLDPAAGRAAAEWVIHATRAAMDGTVSGVVTCPISKECIRAAGYDYFGHTDLIAELTGALDYRMCLFTDTMRIVHVTAHCALREAIALLSTARIAESIRIGYESLRKLNVNPPRIAVAGLNPHAGEGGVFGREEIDIIAPAIASCREAGIPCTGPYPPDTVFRRMREGEFDMVVAMYHDQGHIALKLMAMDEGVNVTLGIPIVRTSVDHGTAYDIAWQNVAREDSLCAALRFAARLAGAGPQETST